VELDSDMMKAALDLAGRTGAFRVDIGFDDEADGWYMTTAFNEAEIEVSGYRAPDEAAYGLARRLLAKATCRCGRQVTLDDPQDRDEELATPRYFCRWRLAGARWEAGCDVPPVQVKAERGDYAAIRAALEARRVGG
jgi:hypothetical protein